MMKKLLQCSLVKKRFGRLKNVEAKKIDQILLKFLSQPIARPPLQHLRPLFSSLLYQFQLRVNEHSKMKIKKKHLFVFMALHN